MAFTSPLGFPTALSASYTSMYGLPSQSRWRASAFDQPPGLDEFARNASRGDDHMAGCQTHGFLAPTPVPTEDDRPSRSTSSRFSFIIRMHNAIRVTESCPNA